MSIPNYPEKYDQPAIIEPSQVIEERGKLGMNPTVLIPEGAIICYDRVLWDWVCTLPNRVVCDGWLTGAFLLEHDKGEEVLVMKAAGVGAPTAVMTLEELIASGVTRVISLGAAGGIQPELRPGEIIICDRALRDEGTSHHYAPAEKFAHASAGLTQNLVESVKKRNLPVKIGPSWTTDAPYRETIAELKHYRSEGILTVEMEAAALFAVGAYCQISVSSVFAISDVLTEDGWHQSYYSDEKISGLQQVFGAALEVLALPTGN